MGPNSSTFEQKLAFKQNLLKLNEKLQEKAKQINPFGED